MHVEEDRAVPSQPDATESRTTPFISVIIPTFQRRDMVVRAVRELGKSSTNPSAYDVIVVVDGSTDGTTQALAELNTPMRLTVLEQPNLGPPAARNTGAAAATGDVLLFLDDDMVADHRMIEEHMRSYDELGADAVLGALAHDPHSPDTLLADEVRRWIEQDFQGVGAIHEVVDPIRARFLGGQFSLRRPVFDRVGAFDSEFNRSRRTGNEDADLNLRLRASGARVVFNGRALSTHTYTHGYRSMWRRFECWGRSDVGLDRKHPERDERKTRPVPPPGTRKGLIARGTLRHPHFTSAAAAPLGLVAGPLVDRGNRDPLTRKLAYVTLTHRYWLGVAMEGGGHDLGVGGPAPMLAVLAYHRLSPAPVARHRPWATSPARMAQQVRAAVEDGWQLVTPDEAAAFLSGSERIPLRSLLITFDDGYADLADRGLPVLRDLGARAVVFVVTGKIGGRADWSDEPGPNPSPLLDVDRLRSLAAAGDVEFGVHGRTHTSMTKLDDASLRLETLDSRQDLETLGLPSPRFLAYPYGEHDSRVRRAAASYLGAFTVRSGLVRPDADWTELPRIEVLAGLTPRQLVWRLRLLSWGEGARQAAGIAQRVGRKAIRRLVS